MTTPSLKSDRVLTLSKILMGYLSLVILVGLALPILSLLESKSLVGGRQMLPWATLMAIGFIVFWRRVAKACTGVSAWILEPTADRYRWVVVGCGLLIFTSYSWQLHIGIAHRGVPGWVYLGLPDVVTPNQPDGLSVPAGVDRAVFETALRPVVLPYLTRSGYASSEVIFLHFKDGTMRPANYQLAMVSWPKATFGVSDGQIKHSSEFFGIIKHNFRNLRTGSAMFIPRSLSYPSHLNYQVIDYTQYPPADDLIGISLWNLTAKVDLEQQKLEVVGASKIAQVNA